MAGVAPEFQAGATSLRIEKSKPIRFGLQCKSVALRKKHTTQEETHKCSRLFFVSYCDNFRAAWVKTPHT
jgi:hypothetical protein